MSYQLMISSVTCSSSLGLIALTMRRMIRDENRVMIHIVYATAPAGSRGPCNWRKKKGLGTVVSNVFSKKRGNVQKSNI